jgi:hypothetical protein
VVLLANNVIVSERCAVDPAGINVTFSVDPVLLPRPKNVVAASFGS